MTFIYELLVGAAFPTLRAAAMWPIAAHTVAPRASGAWHNVPMASTVDALKSVHLDNPAVGIVYSGVAVGSHSSQAMVALVFGVAPDEMLRSPSPFAVPTADLISRPGLAFQV